MIKRPSVSQAAACGAGMSFACAVSGYANLSHTVAEEARREGVPEGGRTKILNTRRDDIDAGL